MTSDQELKDLSERVGRWLVRRGLTIATAESCTGGWVAKSITDIAGSSQWFAQGWVTYSNDAKRQLLGVPKTALQRHGAVSEVVVRAMARAALALSCAHIAVAVSGIAGPGGAVPGKPIGTVWFAWSFLAGKRILVHTTVKQFRGDRDAVRRSAVRIALTGIYSSRDK